jgi:hypothetical protein
MTVLVTAPLNPHRMVTHAKAGFRIPQDPLILTATTTSTSPSPISTSVHAAFADPIWRTAMEEEYGTLMRNGTWELVPRPPTNGYSRTNLSHRTFNRYKAHWVLQGFTQHLL